MLSRSLAALNRRRNRLDENEKGFTLIELLVVVIIIGILAAIAIPIYIGVQDSAKDSGVKSDLTNAKIALIAFQTDTGAWPTVLADASGTGSAALVKFGWTKGTTTTTLALKALPTAAGVFCIDGVSSTTKTFKVTDSAGVVSGTCP